MKNIGRNGDSILPPGATGNITTEDLVHMLEEMGMKTNVDLDHLIDLSRKLPRSVGRGDLPGQVVKAGKVSELHQA